METIIFIGIQATGKSSYYQQFFFNSHIRINLDMLKTRHRESLLLKACLAMKHSFVVDNTNPSKMDRRRYIIPAKQAGFTISGYYFQSQLKESMSRNKQREANAIIPDIGIRSTYSKLEIPNYEEGFDKLYYISIGNDHTFKLEGWQDEV